MADLRAMFFEIAHLVHKIWRNRNPIFSPKPPPTVYSEQSTWQPPSDQPLDIIFAKQQSPNHPGRSYNNEPVILPRSLQGQDVYKDRFKVLKKDNNYVNSLQSSMTTITKEEVLKNTKIFKTVEMEKDKLAPGQTNQVSVITLSSDKVKKMDNSRNGNSKQVKNRTGAEVKNVSEDVGTEVVSKTTDINNDAIFRSSVPFGKNTRGRKFDTGSSKDSKRSEKKPILRKPRDLRKNRSDTDGGHDIKHRQSSSKQVKKISKMQAPFVTEEASEFTTSGFDLSLSTSRSLPQKACST